MARAGTGNRGAQHAAALTLLAVTLAGCAADPVPPRPLSTAPSTVDAQADAAAAAEEAASAEVLATFARFQRLERELSADPPPPAEAEARLAEQLAGAAHSRMLLAMQVMRDAGLARDGAPEAEAQVVAVALADTPPSATVRECLDTTGWPVVARDGAAPADLPPELYGAASGRYLRTVHLERYEDGQWRLSSYDRPMLQEATGGTAGC